MSSQCDLASDFVAAFGLKRFPINCCANAVDDPMGEISVLPLNPVWVECTSNTTDQRVIGISIDQAANCTAPTDWPVASLEHLTHLNINYCNMSSYQLQWDKLSTGAPNLIHLNLSNNELGGGLSPDIGKLVQLESLDLSFNNLNSAFPYEMALLTNLSELIVRNNQLFGQIPPYFNTLPLTRLDLRRNRFAGPLPDLQNLTNLSFCRLGKSTCYSNASTVPSGCLSTARLCDAQHGVTNQSSSTLFWSNFFHYGLLLLGIALIGFLSFQLYVKLIKNRWNKDLSWNPLLGINEPTVNRTPLNHGQRVVVVNPFSDDHGAIRLNSFEQ
ncbi:hypothetical protein BC833DRAFT_583693 [Globomyces pollinis-pini]|nr:hypothetical protein BC833DRAFT_583693 [Globomyces pollinis-pini]